MKILYTALPVFFVGIVLGLSLSVASVAQPAHASLGSDIVCMVFTDLDHIGTPIPFLSTGNCPPNSATSTMPTLTVTKVVAGGTKQVSDFPLLLNGLPITSGVATTKTPGNYTITEINTDVHYAGTFSGDCDSSGHITLLANTTKSCTLTNTYTAPGGGGSGPHATSTDLSVTKTVSTSTPTQGQTVTYTLTVHNAGPDAADHVSVTDMLPSGLTYVSDTGSGSYIPSTGVWVVGSVATTSNVSLSIVATVGSTTSTITNTASVVGSNSTDPNSANNSASTAITPAAPATNNGGGTSDTGGSTGGDNTGGTTGGTGGNGNNTVSGGGGGGGVISGPLSYGYGGIGAVLGTSTGEVLGTSTGAACGSYLAAYLRMGRSNNVDQVKKLQTFLNSYGGAKLPITGYFGKLTDAAVRKFQMQYAAEVLLPWAPYGLATNTPTGYVYKTTLRKINLMMCSALNIPMPMLP